MSEEPDDPTLAAIEQLVARQRDTNAGLRQALRYRGVIEQAKGIITAQTRADPDDAFQHLVRQSQRTNLKVVQVAAGLVAHTLRHGAPAPGSLPTDADVASEAVTRHATEQLVRSAAITAPDLSHLLDAVVQHLADLGMTAAMIALIEPDGALRVAATYGIDEASMSGWLRVPPGDDLPCTAIARTERTLWFRNHRDRLDRFPAARRFPLHREGGAVLPLRAASSTFGVLTLESDHELEDGEEVRERLTSIATLCGEVVAELAHEQADPLPGFTVEPANASWFHGLLDALPIPALIVRPVEEDGRVSDVIVVHSNRLVQEHVHLQPEQSLLEQQPELLGTDLLACVTKLAETEGAVPYTEVELPLEGRPTGVTAARVGGLIMLIGHDRPA